MFSVKLAMLILALICFALSAIEVAAPRVNLLAAGLFFYILSLLLAG